MNARRPGLFDSGDPHVVLFFVAACVMTAIACYCTWKAIKAAPVIALRRQVSLLIGEAYLAVAVGFGFLAVADMLAY